VIRECEPSMRRPSSTAALPEVDWLRRSRAALPSAAVHWAVAGRSRAAGGNPVSKSHPFLQPSRDLLRTITTITSTTHSTDDGCNAAYLIALILSVTNAPSLRPSASKPHPFLFQPSRVLLRTNRVLLRTTTTTSASNHDGCSADVKPATTPNESARERPRLQGVSNVIWHDAPP